MGPCLPDWALKRVGPFETKTQATRKVTRAVDEVSARLGNTPAICRAFYIHPELIAAFLDGGLASMQRRSGRGRTSGLNATEAPVVRLLRARTARAGSRTR
jgi:DNA topoisomerase I